MASHKMVSLARQLAEDLGLRLSSLGAVVGVNSAGNQTVTVGTLSAGNQAAYIVLKEQASIQTDGLGNAQRSFGPHVVQVVLEASSVTGVAEMTLANLTKLLGECFKHGVKTELYLTADGTAPALAEITAANLKATWDHLYQPFTSSM